jgi:hypothetical protein
MLLDCASALFVVVGKIPETMDAALRFQVTWRGYFPDGYMDTLLHAYNQRTGRMWRWDKSYARPKPYFIRDVVSPYYEVNSYAHLRGVCADLRIRDIDSVHYSRRFSKAHYRYFELSSRYYGPYDPSLFAYMFRRFNG